MLAQIATWFHSLALTATALLALNATATTTPGTLANTPTTPEEISASLHAKITDLRAEVERAHLADALPLTRPLYLGTQGPDVKALQNILVSLNFITPELATGYFGSDTERAVRKFQTFYELNQTGVVDRETLDKLFEVDISHLNLTQTYFPEEAQLLAVATSSDELVRLSQESTGTPACDPVDPQIVYFCPPDANVSASAQTAVTQTFSVTGSNYAFSPKTLTVAKGTLVTVHFSVTTGTHNFVIDAFGAKSATTTGTQVSNVTFTASSVGNFTYYSSIGTDKNQGMTGTLTVSQ